MAEYPQHDRAKACEVERNAIGGFREFLDTKEHLSSQVVGPGRGYFDYRAFLKEKEDLLDSIRRGHKAQAVFEQKLSGGG